MEKRKTSSIKERSSPDAIQKVQITSGDATEVNKDILTVITHVVNDINVWGAGFVLALSKRWAEPKKEYHRLCSLIDEKVLLGTSQFVKVEENTYVCNMFAMNGVASKQNHTPLCMASLAKCLMAVKLKAEKDNFKLIQMPKIGSGLARGNWNDILKLINIIFRDSNVSILVKTIP